MFCTEAIDLLYSRLVFSKVVLSITTRNSHPSGLRQPNTVALDAYASHKITQCQAMSKWLITDLWITRYFEYLTLVWLMPGRIAKNQWSIEVVTQSLTASQ